MSANVRTGLCSFTFADGRRCRTPRYSRHPHLCFYHARKEVQARAVDQLGSDIQYFFSGDYLSACDLNCVLGRLFTAVVQGQIKPRTAGILAYLAQTLIQSIKLAEQEYIEAFDTDVWRDAIRSSVENNSSHNNPTPSDGSDRGPAADDDPDPSTDGDPNPNDDADPNDFAQDTQDSDAQEDPDQSSSPAQPQLPAPPASQASSQPPPPATASPHASSQPPPQFSYPSPNPHATLPLPNPLPATSATARRTPRKRPVILRSGVACRAEGSQSISGTKPQIKRKPSRRPSPRFVQNPSHGSSPDLRTALFSLAQSVALSPARDPSAFRKPQWSG